MHHLLNTPRGEWMFSLTCVGLNAASPTESEMNGHGTFED